MGKLAKVYGAGSPRKAPKDMPLVSLSDYKELEAENKRLREASKYVLESNFQVRGAGIQIDDYKPTVFLIVDKEEYLELLKEQSQKVITKQERNTK